MGSEGVRGASRPVACIKRLQTLPSYQRYKNDIRGNEADCLKDMNHGFGIGIPRLSREDPTRT